MEIRAPQIREAVFEIFRRQGKPLSRVNKGQQWIVRTPDGTKAILKTAAKGGLMVKTETLGNDAKIIGFDADATHIIAGVCDKDSSVINAYLVPLKVAENAFRRNNREWLDADPNHNQNQTWVLSFSEKAKPYFGSQMGKVWSEYRVGSIDILVADGPAEGNSTKDVLERCRSEIANAYGVEPEQVRISVDL